jgi:hypothetical protein
MLLAATCSTLTLIGRPGSLNRLRAVADDAVQELCRTAATGESAGALVAAVRRRLGSRLASADEALHLQLREDLIEQGLLKLAETPEACLHADVVICASSSEGCATWLVVSRAYSRTTIGSRFKLDLTLAKVGRNWCKCHWPLPRR